MQTIDLKEALQGFFSIYLLEQKQVSPHTLKSYRDTFKLLLEFARKEKGGFRALRPCDIDVPLIMEFLKNLEDPVAGRGNSIATRNYRLAAIRSFFQYLSWQYPGIERLAKRIQAIPIKRSRNAKLDFLTRTELKAFLSQVNPDELEGFRDLALLTYLYNTGARSQEVADTRISWIDFANQVATITGKGNKERLVPLWPTTLKAIRTYLDEYRRKPKLPGQDFLFINQRGTHLTRFGIRRIVHKYLQRAKSACESLRSKRLSTHSLRHTTAVHLLESGVEVNVIKAWLGHADLSSTSRYLDADLNHKKEALDKFGPPIYVAGSLEKKTTSSTDQILSWLKDF
ncbi:MAG: tyrosine-type recombinase/integrase [Elusimicrobia bacterium]|nr:tyrosine-type recombinase/integrase [Elusimicrobiota bacterium]